MKTKIAEIHKNEILVRGVDLVRLAESHSFAEMVLIMAGLLPNKVYAQLVNRMLVLVSDHGLTPPSTMSVRLAASCGASLPQALSGGFACFGDHHISPIGDAYDHFIEELSGSFEHKKVIPGFGHVLHDRDPRAMALITFAQSVLKDPAACKLALITQERLKKPLNLGGAIAAVAVDIGLPREFAVGIALMGRSLGLVTHYTEQRTHKQKVICYDAGTEKFIREGH